MAKSTDKKAKDKKPKAKKPKVDNVKPGKAKPNKVVASVSPLAPKGGLPELPAIDGVRLATARAGVKFKGRTDLMLAELAPGTSVAGVFTRSQTAAAPVLKSRETLTRIATGKAGRRKIGILVNSGNANAFTGTVGVEAVAETTGRAAKSIGTAAANMFVASTGVIGEPLPADKIVSKLDKLSGQLGKGTMAEAAAAIMTTDTYPKGATRTVMLGETPVTITGIAKGSGMIAPDMATMLSFVFTDAAVTQPALQRMLNTGVARSFNAITVDSDTSTSDTVILAATGMARTQPIKSATSVEGRAFAAALHELLRDLAHQIVRDGEGATKFVEVTVAGATSARSAKTVAMAIANSPLVKTAFAGEDPNWGRIVAAIGKAGQTADRDRLSISFGDIVVAENGQVAQGYCEKDGADYMRNETIKIGVDLRVGAGEATVWTCDMTKRYIEINTDYRS